MSEECNHDADKKLCDKCALENELDHLRSVIKKISGRVGGVKKYSPDIDYGNNALRDAEPCMVEDSLGEWIYVMDAEAWLYEANNLRSVIERVREYAINDAPQEVHTRLLKILDTANEKESVAVGNSFIEELHFALMNYDDVDELKDHISKLIEAHKRGDYTANAKKEEDNE